MNELDRPSDRDQLPLGPFLERYAFRDDRKRPLFLGAAERPPVVEEDALRRAAAAATRVRGSS